MPATILFLASNPGATSRLALDEEARDIELKIRAGDHRDAITLQTRWAVRVDDLLLALNRDNPTVVHFSGHGSGVPGIVLHSEDGNAKLVKASALRSLFSTLKGQIRVVVLNACYSIDQAQAIAETIDCVIGMSAPVDDDSARRFAAAFYGALGFARSVQNAFDQGLSALHLHGLDDHAVPKLITRPGVRPDQVFIVPP